MSNETAASSTAGVAIRLLEAHEAGRLGDAVRAVYGETYPVRWTYDAKEVAWRISEGCLLSAIAETEDGELLCHAAVTLRGPHDRVGHAGQAVTLPAARGRHLFTAVKRYLADRAQARGLIGMYSEATASHPFSQRANVDLGAHETGFLLGYIPGSVENSVVSGGTAKQSAALFYLRLCSGALRPVYAPHRHREVVRRTIAVTGFHARLADPPLHRRVPPRSTLHAELDAGDNIVVLTATEPGADLVGALASARDRWFARGIDALYVDLPLELPHTALLADELDQLELSFCGMFPNCRGQGDVLRLQTMRDATILAHDVAVASAHGQELLDYVVADLEAVGHRVLRQTDEAAADVAGLADATPLTTGPVAGGPTGDDWAAPPGEAAPPAVGLGTHVPEEGGVGPPPGEAAPPAVGLGTHVPEEGGVGPPPGEVAQ